jgi:hypothetical protein
MFQYLMSLLFGICLQLLSNKCYKYVVTVLAFEGCVVTMSAESHHERMEKLDNCYKFIRQSHQGIRAAELASKLEMNRTGVYDLLNRLEMADKVKSEHGLWKATENGEQERSSLPREASILLRRIFEQTDEIKNILYEKKDAAQAFERVRFLIAQLEEPIKKEMNVELEKTRAAVLSVSNTRWLFLGDKAYEPIYHNETVRLLSKLYNLIYAKYPMKAMIGSLEK